MMYIFLYVDVGCNIPLFSNVGLLLWLGASEDDSSLDGWGTSEELAKEEQGDCGAEDTGELGKDDEEEDCGDGGESVVTLTRLLGLSVPGVWSSAEAQGSDICFNPHHPAEKKAISKAELDKAS